MHSQPTRAWRTSVATAPSVSPSTRRENSQLRLRRTKLRRDLAQEGNQVQPPESSATGPEFGSRLHAVPTPTRTGARARQRLRDRAVRLHARELEGESAATPAIMLGEVVLV
ncbi:MAG TPA: hypothetical protein VGJ70_19470, partial [Solirubrobacteraceae bacterium]